MIDIKVTIVRPNRISLSRWPKESEKPELAKAVAAARAKGDATPKQKPKQKPNSTKT